MIHIIGGGLAGSEAAWQAAEHGVPVTIHEMRPVRPTAVHQTDGLAELVCSNSFRGDKLDNAVGLLKEEMRRLGSIIMRAADVARVPAGAALAVDRVVFSQRVTELVSQHPRITVCREEVTTIPATEHGPVIIATGPLTSDALSAEIRAFVGGDHLYFYDAISPIVEADSVDYTIAFRASRYGKSIDSSDDYVNCPFNKVEYDAFIDGLLEASKYEPHIPEDNTPYFESCLPIEEIVRRGRDTLRFGPMKPVGLTDPRTGRWPYAAVQLRQENLRADSYNLVGFQNSLKFGEQAKVLRLIPGLQSAKFVRFGQIHRNTYINAPTCLTPTLQLNSDPRIFFAGQISGVEGYVESIATGLMAGRHAATLVKGGEPRPFPRETALGSLCRYITGADPKNYQPANITFDLLPHLDEGTRKKLRHDKKARHAEVCRIAHAALHEWSQ